MSYGFISARLRPRYDRKTKPLSRDNTMAKNIHLTIAAGDMDRVAAIKDGRVQVEGCDVTFIPMEPEEVFFRAFRNVLNINSI